MFKTRDVGEHVARPALCSVLAISNRLSETQDPARWHDDPDCVSSPEKAQPCTINGHATHGKSTTGLKLSRRREPQLRYIHKLAEVLPFHRLIPYVTKAANLTVRRKREEGMIGNKNRLSQDDSLSGASPPQSSSDDCSLSVP